MPAGIPVVLAVVADAEVGQQMEGLLEGRQWHVHLACSEQAAYEQMARQPYDVVVADIDAPSLNGMEVLAHCHRRLPALAVYAITALPHLATRKELARKACGVRGFFYLLDGSLQLDANHHLAARLIANCAAR